MGDSGVSERSIIIIARGHAVYFDPIVRDSNVGHRRMKKQQMILVSSNPDCLDSTLPDSQPVPTPHCLPGLLVEKRGLPAASPIAKVIQVRVG